MHTYIKSSEQRAVYVECIALGNYEIAIGLSEVILRSHSVKPVITPARSPLDYLYLLSNGKIFFLDSVPRLIHICLKHGCNFNAAEKLAMFPLLIKTEKLRNKFITNTNMLNYIHFA